MSKHKGANPDRAIIDEPFTSVSVGPIGLEPGEDGWTVIGELQTDGIQISPVEERSKPAEPVWPPPLAGRADRRACARHRHQGMIKAGYCTLCGTKI